MENKQTVNTSQTFKRLMGLLKPHWLRFSIVIVFALASTIFSIIGPKVMGDATTLLFEGLVNRVKGLGGVDFDAIGRILRWLLTIYIISAIFSYLQGFLMAKVSYHLTYQLRKDMHAKLENLPLSYFDKHQRGDILSLVSNDIDTVDANLTSSVTQFLTSITSLLGILYMMFSIQWKMTLLALLVLPVSFILVTSIFKRSQKHFRLQQSNLGNLNAHIEEIYGSQLLVKAFNGEDKAINDFDVVNEELYDSAWKSQFFSGLVHPIMNFIGNLGYVIVSILGGYYAAHGIISVGEIQSFIQYMRNFVNPIAQLGNLATGFQTSLAAAERVFNFLDAEEVVEDADENILAENLDASVEFKNVAFSYDGVTPVIHNFSAQVTPGQTVAIVGPTGAGKTTLVKLLMRFYDVDQGKIQVGGVDIREMPREKLRSMIGMVLQDTWLYQDTIAENIRYGRLDASDEEIIEAAKKAQADHFIQTLPEGYETVLNEESSNISQGQRQLITIARAILADPKIMILDEATSSVDTRTEILIQKALDVLMQDRTSFIIAHRLSTIRNADLILVMDKGDIVEQGTHEELLAKNGFYAELYQSQFEEED